MVSKGRTLILYTSIQVVAELPVQCLQVGFKGHFFAPCPVVHSHSFTGGHLSQTHTMEASTISPRSSSQAKGIIDNVNKYF